jgi:hypothetical protein
MGSQFWLLRWSCSLLNGDSKSMILRTGSEGLLSWYRDIMIMIWLLQADEIFLALIQVLLQVWAKLCDSFGITIMMI